MKTSKTYTFTKRQEFREWLTLYGNTEEGIWLIFDTSSNHKTLKASEALEEALCFGWIDGQMKKIDETTYQKYFSMRRHHSKWSQKNKALVIILEEKGIMCDEGRKKIEEAKRNGQWDKDQTIIVSDEDMEVLTKQIQGIEPAYTNFLAMSPSIKKTYTKAYVAAKTMEGKQKRLDWIIDRLTKNLKPM